MDRRRFIKAGAAGLASSLFAGSSASSVFADVKDEARIAVIGLGSRGTGLMRNMLSFPGWKPVALCDINERNLNRAIAIVDNARGFKPDGYSKGPEDYKRMIAREDIDGVMITTPAELHAEQSINCMRAGKHVGSEVPAAYTVEECWEIVKTKEKAGVRYMLLENYNYMRNNMMVLNMLGKKVFGTPYYAECSYIHDCARLRFTSQGELTWRGDVKRDRFGSLYPTHAVGPVSKWLDIHNGDRMVRLSSYMSKPLALHAYAVRQFGKDSEAARIEWSAGDMCHTLIQTQKGKLINIQYDSDSPRPTDNFYLVQGTEGLYDSRRGIHVVNRSRPGSWDRVADYREEFEHDYWRKDGEAAAQTGHSGADYFTVRDFIGMVRENKEPWIDVYDAVTWSAIVELSQMSIRNDNNSVEFPDFTNGAWEKKV